MIDKLVKELDRCAAQALKACAQPMSAGVDVSYEAGRRIGYAQGIAQARQAILDFHEKDNAADDKL